MAGLDLTKQVNVQSTKATKMNPNILNSRAVVVAQLVERLLPIPEVRGSNPVIGKNLHLN